VYTHKTSYKAEVGTGKERAKDCKALGWQAYSFSNTNPSVKCDHIETYHHVRTSPYYNYFSVGGLIHRQTYGVVKGSAAST
jgi:hypothetical protein